MTFYVGQEVEYIGKNYSPIDCPCDVPNHDHCQKGAVYVVSNLFFACGKVNLGLVGMRQPGNGTWIPGYRSELFRPVVKPKRETSTETGMDILRAIRDGKLDPGSERERLKRRKTRVPVEGYLS